jgi:hypothetical protein
LPENIEILSQPGNDYNSISISSQSFINDLKTRIRVPYTKISYDLFDEINIANFTSINNTVGIQLTSIVYDISGGEVLTSLATSNHPQYLYSTFPFSRHTRWFLTYFDHFPLDMHQ